MENQHRKITGYRDLSQAEVDAMNEIKAEGERLGELVKKVESMDGIDGLSLEYARQELKTGVMWLVRAIAQPTTF